MTTVKQRTRKFLLTMALIALGLITAFCRSAPLAAAPDSQSHIAQASPELARQFQKLGRDYRIQIYNSFRLDRAEYDRRRGAWSEVRQMWQTSGGRVEVKQTIIRWLQDGIRNSAPGKIAPLPLLPEFKSIVTQPPAPPTLSGQSLELPRKRVLGAVEVPLGERSIPTLPPRRVRAAEVSPQQRESNMRLPSNRPGPIPLQARTGEAPHLPVPGTAKAKTVTPRAGLSAPRTGQDFSPIRGSIEVAPRSREGDLAGSRLHPARPSTRPSLPPDNPQTIKRTPTNPRSEVPAISSQPSPAGAPTPRVARRQMLEPTIDPLPARKLTEPSLRRRALEVQPPTTPLHPGDNLARTLLRSSKGKSEGVIPPDRLASIERHPVRSRRPAPATAIELPPLEPPSQRVEQEHAEINLVELAAHIAGHNRGMQALENRLLLGKRWTPKQLSQEVTELVGLGQRRETITLYLRLLTPEIRQTLPSLKSAGNATDVLGRRIRETRTIVSRGSFPSKGDENQLEEEILDAASRKLAELTNPPGQP